MVVYDLRTKFSESVIKAVALLKGDSIVAVPTDTIYGIAANAENNNAIRKIYAIKNRNFSKPLAVCVHHSAFIHLWGKTDHLPDGLLNKLLPGPVTVVLDRTERLSPSLNPTCSRVALRVPRNDFIRAVTKGLNAPIALTSANQSGEDSCVSVDEFKSLWPKLDAIFDAGTLGDYRTGSTIVDLSENGLYKVIREGGYLEETAKILQEFDLVENHKN